MAAPASRYITPEEYLAAERAAIDVKSEYFDGHVYAMSGARLAHNRIASNLIASVSAKVRGTECEAMGSDMRVMTPRTSAYTYPDLSIVCGEPRLADDQFDVLLNPTVLIEILSPSTEALDRGKKFHRYKEIESLQEYVLVEQDRASVDVFLRTSEGWLNQSYTDSSQVVGIQSLGIELPMVEIYDRVAFESA